MPFLPVGVLFLVRALAMLVLRAPCISIVQILWTLDRLPRRVLHVVLVGLVATRLPFSAPIVDVVGRVLLLMVPHRIGTKANAAYRVGT